MAIKSFIQWLIGISFLIGLILMTVLTTDHLANIATVKAAANQVFAATPVVRDLTIAQAILESDLGENQPWHAGQGGSELAVKYNNLFGIKWPEYQEHIAVAEQHGKPINLPTKEVVNGVYKSVSAQFIWFNSVEDCLQYRQYMLSWSMYKNVYSAQTVQDAAQQIYMDGYASDPTYPSEVVRVWQEYVK